MHGCNSLSSLPPQIGKLTSLSLTMFFVGKEEGLCMAELKLLKLKGDLHIKHLEKVKSVMDASKASMSRYNGVHFPQWMSSSPSLKYLELEDRKVCSQLPELGKLLFLKTMHVYNMIRVKHLFEESYDGGVVFMALGNLSLEKLPNLTRLSRDDGESMFPHLSKLEITECPKLSGFPSLPSINDLHIQGRGLATHSSHPHY
ncbi:Putative disease resistance protein RGA3 [Glycine soja]|uniref:Putative disease resistance protein RGA3 n=1 Tax=Glycine soja TaxID=3848 RepID=A0A0B2R4V1_GLYSO|nr:Putative disease resistance protein RGA3 [Glycine soja]